MAALKSNQFEKTAAEIAAMIKSARDIALFCHVNPDGDALGSMLAMRLALKNMGKEASVYCDGAVPAGYRCLEGSEYIKNPTGEGSQLAIALDCSDIDRLGFARAQFASSRHKIAIDHHKSFVRFADINLVDGGAAACAQVLYRLLRYIESALDVKIIDESVAKLLFSGIVTDSGCFRYSSVTPETHLVAYELMKYDFDAADTIYNVYSSSQLNKFKLKCRVLSKARFEKEGNIAFIAFDDEDFAATETTMDDTEGIVSELIDISSVKVAFAISKVGEMRYKASIRTKDPVDAAEIAATFGGGGHKNAAGCRINGYFEDIIDKLVYLASNAIGLV